MPGVLVIDIMNKSRGIFQAFFRHFSGIFQAFFRHFSGIFQAFSGIFQAGPCEIDYRQTCICSS
jgi:hypothetical protein